LVRAESPDALGNNVWHEAGMLGKPDVDTLLRHATPSKFGDLRSGTDVLDEGVRRACEVRSDRLLLLTPCGWPVWWHRSMLVDAVCAEAAHALRPGRTFVLRPHKLNIYGPDDFIVDHVDTPRDADMIGTAIVGLPTVHTGGELVVSHADTSFRHGFAQETSDNGKQTPEATTAAATTATMTTTTTTTTTTTAPEAAAETAWVSWRLSMATAHTESSL
jgi:hypothetical protein